MRKIKLVAMLMSLVLLFTALPVQAVNMHDITDKMITIDDIYNPEPVTIYISDESIYFPNGPISKAYGTYPIYTRVRVVQRSSNGLIERDSKLGTYASIASIALSFAGYAPAMTVGTILSVVGLFAGSSTYVQGKTYTSYVEYVKNGEAKWSDDPAYSTWVASGKRDHYKHVLGGKQNDNGQWTTSTKDYLSSPVSVDIGSFFNNSDSWFKTQAEQRIQSGLFLDDLPW